MGDFETFAPVDAFSTVRLFLILSGLAEAPSLWNLHLFEAITDLGFVPSDIDPCLMVKKDIFLVFFCDDAGVAAKSEAAIDELVDALNEKGFELTGEQSFSEFLGIKYEELSDGSISMTQK